MTVIVTDRSKIIIVTDKLAVIDRSVSILEALAKSMRSAYNLDEAETRIMVTAPL